MEYKLIRSQGEMSDLVVEGLEPGPLIKKFHPDVEEVTIFPGLEHSCRTDASYHQGIGTQLYDLFQTEFGANLKDGDTFIFEEKGWKWECIHVHVLPVKGTYPQEWDYYKESDR